MKGHRTYQDGVKDGMHLASNAFKEDISNIYGIMCDVLIDSGNASDECLDLMAQIQERWIQVTDSGESVKDYLRRKLPFEIMQVAFGEQT